MYFRWDTDATFVVRLQAKGGLQSGWHVVQQAMAVPVVGYKLIVSKVEQRHARGTRVSVSLTYLAQEGALPMTFERVEELFGHLEQERAA